MSENARPIWHEAAPQAGKALSAIHHYIDTGTNLPEELVHLVFLRVSQINGCAYCIDLHTRDLLKTMAIETVVLVPVWAEAPHLFPDQYRAALAWAEQVTRVAETHDWDYVFAAAAAVFEPKDLIDLTIAIATMNAVNRLNVPLRVPVKPKA